MTGAEARTDTRRAAGYSLVECVVVVAVLASVLAVGSPMTAAVIHSTRARQAAGYVASTFRLARQNAALRGASEGIVFDFAGGRWQFRVCADGNGNGVRRAELDGVDACGQARHDLSVLFPEVRIERDPSVPDPGGGAGSTDPVRFGSADIASFSPLGNGTSGTLYLMAPDNTQYAVRVAGLSGRTRILRYDRTAAAWREM